MKKIPGNKNFIGMQTGLLFLLLFASGFVSFAQTNPANTPKFIVVDSATGAPLSKITVYVFNKTENKIISGSLSNDSGHCFLKDEWLADSNNIITFNAVNYKEKYIQFSTKQPAFPVKVLLTGNAKMLKEVTISSNRNMINFNGNRMEYDISNLPNVKNMTTSDVLDYLPFMRVDENNVKLMNETLTILINGKPHPFYNNVRNLNALPPQAIEQIIVNLVPSSRFGSKVMNIILKKNYFLGWNGSFNAASSLLGFASSGQASYWQNKIGIDVAASFNTMKTTTNTSSLLQSFTNKSLVLQSGKATSNTINGALSASVFYNVDSLNSVNFLYSFSPARIISNDGYDINMADSFALQYLENSFMKRHNNTHGSAFNLNYTRLFKKKGKQVYVLSGYKDGRGVHTYDLIKNKQKPDSLLQWEQFTDDNSTKEASFEAGYDDQSNNKFRYNAGGKIINRRNTSDKWLAELASPTDTVGGFFKYSQLVTSAYMDADIILKKFVWHAGLRFDHEDFSYQSPVKLSRTYNGFFPNISLTYNANKYNVLIVTYSRNVLRPALESLVSFSTAQNAYFRESGSTNLQPQYGNNFNLQVFGNYKFGQLGINTSYSTITNYIDIYYTKASNGEITKTDFNTSQYKYFTLGISAEIPISRKVRFSHFSSGTIIDQKGAGLNTSKLSGYLSERLYYQINKLNRISISAVGYTPNINLQGKSQGMAYINTKINYSYFLTMFNKYPVGLSCSLSNPWYPNGTPGYSEARDASFYYYASSKAVNPIVSIQAVINFKGKKFQEKPNRQTKSIENNDLKSK
jgi:hypothetical protein